MQAELIIDFVKNRARERNAAEYILDYEQLIIGGNQTKTILAQNAIYFLVGDPKFVVIESDNGLYGNGNRNTHEHSGSFSITNPESTEAKISFVKAIFIDKPEVSYAIPVIPSNTSLKP